MPKTYKITERQRRLIICVAARVTLRTLMAKHKETNDANPIR